MADQGSQTLTPVRALAFYLPQFHPIPENDAWWGKGFTEWTNVIPARPRFSGHYQPHLPADLGLYDLRIPEVQAAQAALAQRYGIHGFCYYHYWFDGKQLLERPVEQLLRLGRPDFPFCLCWANENWSRTWDGRDKHVLMAQRYSAEDDEAHFAALLPAFRDPRYIKVRGRPFFLIYRASQLPEPAVTIARWQKLARNAGLPGLYLANVEGFLSERGLAQCGDFDAAVEFAPDWGEGLPRLPLLGHSITQRVFRKFGRGDPVLKDQVVFDYDALAARMLAKPPPSYLRFPCVTPSWDNSARKKSGVRIFHGSTPQRYQAWLAETVRRFNPPSAEENFVFINAWNEWAEGSHLEPCERHGHAYLEATRAALGGASRPPFAASDPIYIQNSA